MTEKQRLGFLVAIGHSKKNFVIKYVKYVQVNQVKTLRLPKCLPNKQLKPLLPLRD
ncbi:hypothetical protein QUB37_09065 [Microcoleus sp. AT3-A2]|uniref:hypothetical protein n=1 Tax=unclassified Microcoleus TaxID=2642155 RepID=UPI002FD46241